MIIITKLRTSVRNFDVYFVIIILKERLSGTIFQQEYPGWEIECFFCFESLHRKLAMLRMNLILFQR